jgi:hypothetical protein
MATSQSRTIATLMGDAAIVRILQQLGLVIANPIR